ncbi:MAG: YwaF family protein [Bacilli bacterium]|nr:YwaF family protein [Bacilli bacterium]
MDKLIHFFQYQVEEPGLFSLFHIVFLVIIVSMTVFISIRFKNCSEKTYKKIILICWIICLIMESIKQIVKSFVYGSPSYFKYSFYDLPFHLCSLIYYIAPVLIFVKREKASFLYDALSWFMAIFSLFGGVIVILFNSIVMSTLLYTNIQTMIHHGIQVLLGVFIVTWNRKRLNIHSFLKSLVILSVYTILAILINVLITPVSNGIDMFYVNPYEVSVIPVINEIHRNVGFTPYLMVYLLLIILMGFITYMVEVLIVNKFNFRCVFNKGDSNEKREENI